MLKIFFIVLLIGFVTCAGFNLAESVTPYVTIAEARSSESIVQVKGLLDKNFVPQQTCDEFTFSLVDETTGEVMRVKFDGIKPDRFDEADYIVAVGKYDAADESFHAKKILINVADACT